MARAVLIIILGLGCSLAAASPSLRGQERRLPHVTAQAQVEAAAVEAQMPDLQPAQQAVGQDETPEGQERRLDQAQVPTEGPADAAAVEAQAADFQQAPASAANPAWEGKYADPWHVGCKREIKANGLNLTISGTTGTPGPGCGAGDTETSWAIPASITSLESPDIVIDFSPGHPSGASHAKWDGDGIMFADGHKWKKLSANATEAAEVPANVSARTVVGAALAEVPANVSARAVVGAYPVCAENGEICWRAADCCSGRCALTELCAPGR